MTNVKKFSGMSFSDIGLDNGQETTLKPGVVLGIGEYELLEVIGEGGKRRQGSIQKLYGICQSTWRIEIFRYE